MLFSPFTILYREVELLLWQKVLRRIGVQGLQLHWILLICIIPISRVLLLPIQYLNFNIRPYELLCCNSATFGIRFLVWFSEILTCGYKR